MYFKIAKIINHNFAYCAKMFKKYDKTISLFSVIFITLGINTYFLKKKVDRLERGLKNSGIEIDHLKAEKAAETLES